MPKQLYLLDTVNSIRNYESNYEGNSNIGAHSFNVLFPLRFPVRNLKSITFYWNDCLRLQTADYHLYVLYDDRYDDEKIDYVKFCFQTLY